MNLKIVLTLRSGEFITEYTGHVLSDRQAALRNDIYRSRKRYRNKSYIQILGDGRVIDATSAGGLARFINKSLNPNCHTKIVSINQHDYLMTNHFL